MADALSNDVAISLLGNTIATGAILFVLITIFSPVSGAHFNPAVSFVFYLRGDLAGGNDPVVYDSTGLWRRIGYMGRARDV